MYTALGSVALHFYENIPEIIANSSECICKNPLVMRYAIPNIK